MGLIFRSIVEIDDETFVDGAEALFDAWCQKKMRRADVTSRSGTVEAGGITYELTITEDRDDVVHAWRGQSFEQRPDEQVRLSFTAIQNGSRAWAWTDVERWTDEIWAPSWIPYAPVLIPALLDRFPGRVGMTRLTPKHDFVEGVSGTALGSEILNLSRTVPIVVASPTREELAGNLEALHQRASELQRRLAGIARVVALGTGAVTTLSKSLTDELGHGWDVYGGAVRTYLPGVGDDRDDRWRHRLIPARLATRDRITASRLACLPLITSACVQAPPEPWQDRARLLPAFARGAHGVEDAGIFEDLLHDAEDERNDALDAAQEAREREQDAQSSVAELMTQIDSFARRIDYLEGELARVDQAAVHAQPAEVEPFVAEWCEEVAQHAIDTLDYLVIPDVVVTQAADLDVHTDNASWAQKAWRALRALNAYARAKEAGDADNWDFRGFCAHSGHSAVIPEGWVAMHESKSTDNDPRFRRLRTLPVSEEVEGSADRMYMPAHIRIEKGGTPCPRIHFYDDTEGATGKVHIGWFGDHLDSGAKS